jgi:hypothetical protein
MCGDTMLTSEELFCYRCKEDAGKLGAKREIYDKQDITQSQNRFSELFVGSVNYKEMRRRNLENGY